MLSWVRACHSRLDPLNQVSLIYVLTGALFMGGLGILLVKTKGLRINGSPEMENRKGVDCVFADCGAKWLLFVLAYHLHAPGNAVPRRRMDAGCGQRGEHPDKIVRHEEMWPGRPALLVLVIIFQVLHPLFSRSGVPLA